MYRPSHLHHQGKNAAYERLRMLSCCSLCIPSNSCLEISAVTRLFSVLNTPEKLRSKDLPDFLQQFPYVNGGLFRDAMPLPIFSTRSRNAIVKSGELDWAAINPDIFGSMIQNVVTAEDRGDLGIHYTSVCSMRMFLIY